MLVAVLPRAGSPIAQRLLSGAFWSLAGEAGARILTLLSAIVVARQLGAAEFGAFALIQSTITMLTIFAGFGMGQTASRYVATHRSGEKARVAEICNLTVTFSAAMGLVAAFALYVFAPMIASSILNRPDLAGVLRLSSLVLLLSAIAGAANGVLIGFEAFKDIARNTWASSVVSFLATVTGVWTGGLTGAVIGLVLGELFRCVLAFAMARSVLRGHGLAFLATSGLKEARLIWEFGLPSALGSLLNAPVIWVCQTMVAAHPNGLAELGIYDAALKWLTVVSILPLAASAAFLPVLSSLSQDGTNHKRATLQLGFFQFGVTALTALPVALAAPFAMQVFGPSFAPGVPVVVIMMLLAPVFVINRLCWQVLTSMGRAWSSLLIWMLWGVLALGLTWAWQEGGALGLAKANLAASVITLSASMTVIRGFWRERTPAVDLSAGTAW